MQAHLLPGLFQATSCAVEQELARQTAGDIDEHCPNGQPAQDRIEVDARVHQHQQGAGPGHVLVQAQQSGRLPPANQFALAQRIARRSDDQDDAGNAEIAPDPHHVGDVQKRIDETNRRIKDEASARHTTKREAEEYYSAQVQVRQEEINRLNTELHEIRDERTPKAKDRQRDLRALISQNQEFVRQIRTAKNAASASASAENNQRQQELARSRRSLPELTEQRDALKRSYDQELQNYQALQKDKGAYNAKQSSDQTEVASTQDKITLQQSIVARLEADVVTQEAEVHRLTIQPAP